MVEAVVEEELKAHAPVILGGGRGVWTEDDLAQAYGKKSKRCDIVIDGGTALIAADVVSGQLTTATRIDGKPAAFKDDLEKLVFKKIRQLDKTASNLIHDEASLTGVIGLSPRAVYPIVVVGSSFARHPIIEDCIREYVREHNLLSHTLVKQLSVIDISETEMLEGLAAVGHTLIEMLDGWHGSGIAAMSLRNYLLERFSWKPDMFRSPRMRAHVTRVFDDLLSRLKLPPDPSEFRADGHAEGTSP